MNRSLLDQLADLTDTLVAANCSRLRKSTPRAIQIIIALNPCTVVRSSSGVCTIAGFGQNQPIEEEEAHISVNHSQYRIVLIPQAVPQDLTFFSPMAPTYRR